VKIIPQIRIARPIAIILEDSSYAESKFIHDVITHSIAGRKKVAEQVIPSSSIARKTSVEGLGARRR